MRLLRVQVCLDLLGLHHEQLPFAQLLLFLALLFLGLGLTFALRLRILWVLHAADYALFNVVVQAGVDEGDRLFE